MQELAGSEDIHLQSDVSFVNCKTESNFPEGLATVLPALVRDSWQPQFQLLKQPAHAACLYAAGPGADPPVDALDSECASAS